MIRIATLALIFLISACKPTPDTHGPTTQNELAKGERPRLSLDGKLMVFHQGKAGSRQIVVRDVETGTLSQLTKAPHDHRDPTFGPDGIVFASNKAGKYDLYKMNLDGTGQVQITDLPGDATEPSVSPLGYRFFLVYDDGCGPPYGSPEDFYHKVVFSRSYEGKREVWASNIKPATPLGELESSESGKHQSRISKEGQTCAQPAFSGDGVNLLMSCDGQIVDAPATWDQTFEEAAKIVAGDIPEECRDGSGWGEEEKDLKACLDSLPRRYTRYEGQPVSQPTQKLERPAYSTNHTVIVADLDGKPMFLNRGESEWKPFQNTNGDRVRNLVWSPEGDRVVFDKGDKIHQAHTDFYLQHVKNLHLFNELYGASSSKKLAENNFVVRPADHKEFYALHEKLRYQKRPQFISADVALQVFRDEFMRIIEEAEERNAEDLRVLSQALMTHYEQLHAKTKSETDLYLAVYFGTAFVPLQAAHNLVEARKVEDEDEWYKVPKPISSEVPAAIPAVTATLPASIRTKVASNVEKMLASSGIGELNVPSRGEPARIDWTQFIVRGNYAEGDLGGYFLAMSWYAQAPLPFDASLEDFTRTIGTLKVKNGDALQLWNRVNGVVAGFMGKPVDVTVSHLFEARSKTPDIFTKFEAEKAKEALVALRGPVLIRGVQDAESGAGSRGLNIVFLPKRVGLDTTFFRQLLHPDVPMRPFPSALDAMAVMGSERAKSLAVQAQSEDWRAKYQEILEKLTKETPGTQDAGFWSTDIYHSWLAVIGTLAAHQDVTEASHLDFAKSPAWRDRKLFSALAGYVQLKHAAVLYAAQDMSAECGGDTTYLTYTEQPILPKPRGSVEPHPTFFRALSALSGAVYTQIMNKPEGPNYDWNYEDDVLNTKTVVERLAKIAESELNQTPLSPEDLEFIEFFGAKLEAITLGMVEANTGMSAAEILGPARAQRGIAIATDVHTNVMRGEVLQVGIGNIFDLYVIVPDAVGSTLTQGGNFSFYEFTHPMNDRLTDEAWGELLSSPNAPSLPDWTSTFIESGAPRNHDAR